MATRLSEEQLAQQARFVFKGTVQKLKAANVAEIDAKEKSNTIIVRVDEIIQAPDAFAGYTGRDVTVKLGNGPTLKVGDQALFYTNGWIMGDNLAVEEISHRPIEATRFAAAAPGGDPTRNLAERDVQDRLSSADMVVTGRVASIRVPDDAGSRRTGRTAAAAAADSDTRRKPISEHDPEWREAVVEVAGVEKGAASKKKVVVRFPSSNDVRWYKAPKFHPGQEGVFILHKTQQVPATARRTAAVVTPREAETAEAFTALHPADFQPLVQGNQIKTFISASLSTVRKAAKKRAATKAATKSAAKKPASKKRAAGKKAAKKRARR